MGSPLALGSKLRRLARLLGATAMVCVIAYAAVPLHAQSPDVDAVPSGSQMLLEADTLVYDQDMSTVTAVGGVQIEYGGNNLVAERVIYNRQTGRLLAVGKVEIVDQTTLSSTRTKSIYRRFRGRFRQCPAGRHKRQDLLRGRERGAPQRRADDVQQRHLYGMRTLPGQSRQSAGVADQIPEDHLERQDQDRAVREAALRDVRIADRVPAGLRDPRSDRQAQVRLPVPGVSYKSELGYGLSIPYYFALSPTYDLTVTGTGLSRQGSSARPSGGSVSSGRYTLKMAGIYQSDPAAFNVNTVDRGTDIDPNRFRGMVGSKGDFALNSLLEFRLGRHGPDRQELFYTYDIDGFSDYVIRNEVYLTGLNDRNYFDLRAMKFDVQEDVFDGRERSRRGRCPPSTIPTRPTSRSRAAN